MPAFCSAIKLACLENALQALPCTRNAPHCRGIHHWVPSPTAATSACAALCRAHIKGWFALGYYWWTIPSPVLQCKSCWYHVSVPGSRAVLLSHMLAPITPPAIKPPSTRLQEWLSAAGFASPRPPPKVIPVRVTAFPSSAR